MSNKAIWSFTVEAVLNRAMLDEELMQELADSPTIPDANTPTEVFQAMEYIITDVLYGKEYYEANRPK